MTIFPDRQTSQEVQRILIGSVVPRPIALVSSVSAAGVRNLAPFSFFNAVCTEPPVVCFAAARPAAAGKPKKDTLANIEATGEFVVNIVTPCPAHGDRFRTRQTSAGERVALVLSAS